MICAIYCRLSKEDENSIQESESIQNQKNLLISHAVQQEWDIYGIYCDDDYSGADRDRPAWNAMLRDAQAGRFQLVLCKNQSRFTRDMEMLERYIHSLFPLWGVRFVALLDNVDTAVKGNKKARQINGLVNEWYLEDLSENVKAVLDQKRRAGKFIGSFPTYGYCKDPKDHNHLVVDEEAAVTVRQIFSLYVEGCGTHRIAEWLNRLGIPSPGRYKQLKGMRYTNGKTTRYEGCWNHTSVARILKNEFYVGNTVQGTKRKASYKSKKLLDIPREQWVRVENTHEPIIDRETFAFVSSRIGRRIRSDGTGKPHILAQKVRCLDCGSTMQRISHRYKGTLNAYLQCKLYARTRETPQCTSHSIRLDTLTALVEEKIRVYVREHYRLGDVSQFRSEANTWKQRAGIEKEILSLKRREEKLREAVKSLYLDKVDGLVSQEQFSEMNSALQDDKQKAGSRIALLERQLEQLDRRHAQDNILEEQILRILKLDSIRIELVELLIDSVKVGEKDKARGEQQVHIHWKT